MFFPVVKFLNYEGFTNLLYLPPNSWENRIRDDLKIYLICSDGNIWKTKLLRKLSFGEHFEVSTLVDTKNFDESGICLLYPSRQDLPDKIRELPKEKTWVSDNPAWRVTSGIRRNKVQASYQAEIEPLPENASMLTFHPFIQFGDIDNYLFVCNVTQNPKIVSSPLWIIDGIKRQKIDEIIIKSNSANCIPLDAYRFSPDNLPIFYSPKMAGIPFGIGVSRDGNMLSMEHTHPPASLVVFGNRRKIQAKIKKNWVEKFS